MFCVRAGGQRLRPLPQVPWEFCLKLVLAQPWFPVALPSALRALSLRRPVLRSSQKGDGIAGEHWAWGRRGVQMQGQEPAARTKAAGSVAEVWAASELWVIPSRLLGLGLLHARLTLTAPTPWEFPAYLLLPPPTQMEITYFSWGKNKTGHAHVKNIDRVFKEPSADVFVPTQSKGRPACDASEM